MAPSFPPAVLSKLCFDKKDGFINVDCRIKSGNDRRKESPRMTVLQSTKSFTENAGATRGTGHNDINPPRACRAGHPRALYFFLVIPGLDPGIYPSKHKAIHKKCRSIAVSAAQWCRLSATGRTGHPRASTRGSTSNKFSSLSLPDLIRQSTLQSTLSFTNSVIATRVTEYRIN